MPVKPYPLFDMMQPQKGLFVHGAPYHTPQGFLRRAEGIAHTNSRELRSRTGMTRVLPHTNAHSIVRFDDVRFVGSGLTLYRNLDPVLDNLNGDRLSFARMPPTSGITDYLFVSNGGLLQKINPTGTPFLWGIAPPATALTTSFLASIKDIETFNTAATWTATDCTVADEATIALFGNSMKVTITPGDTGTITKNITVDLSVFATGSPATSPDEDWIELWVRLEDPDSVERIEISFSLGNTNFGSNVFTRAVQVQQTIEPFLQQSDVQRNGVSDFEDSFHNQRRIVGREFLATPQDRIRLQDFISQSYLPQTRHTWVQLRLPKSSFTRQGSAATLNWSNVQALRFTIITNNQSEDDVILYLDTMQLHGRVGHQGDYEYYTTFKRANTGTRSNPSPVRRYRNAAREVIQFANIPISTDPQVTQRELWSTIGNGTVPFRLGVIEDNTTTTFENNVSDFEGLDSSGAYPYLEDLELPLDNDRPFDTFTDVLYDAGVCFWLDSAEGRRGRVYYSPPDRHETFAGFLDITDDDDPLQKLIAFNGIRYVFAESGLFRIEGRGIYTARRVENIPGVRSTQRFTVAKVPEGVVWQANDGLRLFDGAHTELLADDRIGSLFRGSSLEGIPAFEGLCAAYGRSEYMISDGTTTLALNRATGQIRSMGFGATALYYEDDTDTWLAALPDGIYSFEREGVFTDGGNPIGFTVRTGALSLANLWGSIVQRLYIRANTRGQQITPRLILGTDTLALTPFQSDNDEHIQEYPLGLTAPWLALEITAELSRQLVLFSAWVDVYEPGVSP